MSLASTVKVVDITRRRKRIRISITPSGSYVTGGDTLDLTATTNPNFLGGAGVGSLPTAVSCEKIPSGYLPEYIPGTTLANGLLKIFTAAGTELTAAAYPAALLAETIELELSGPLWSF